MKLLIYLTLLFSSWTIYGHGGHIATQKLTFSKNEIALEFKIDRNILLHYTKNLFGPDYSKKKGLLLSNYINEKFIVKVNGRPVHFELVSTNQNNQFLFVKMITKCKCKGKIDISVESNLFYEEDPSFENRVIISSSTIEDTSYRLSKTKNQFIRKLKVV